MTDDRSLDPTPHRRQQARREGRVAKSQDLGSAAVLLLGLAALLTLGGGLANFLVDYCRSQLGGGPLLTIDADAAVARWNTTLWAVGSYLLPILGLLCLAGVVANVLQIGLLITPQRVTPDLARLSPLQGLRRVFAAAGLARLGFGVVKLAVVAAVACVVLWAEREQMFGLTGLAPAAIATKVAQLVVWTGIKIGGALLAVATLDYGYQWWRHEQDLKMTPQELREELRNLEGDPQVIARRKQVRRGAALKRKQQ